jgi:hypothetical protein
VNSWIISGIILLAGLIVCLILIFRSKWLASRKNIKDYEEGRDKLTFRKKKEIKKEEKSSDGSHFSLGSLIGCFITILIGGVSLIGPISDQVNTAAATSGSLYNASSWGATVLKIVPGFFAIAILAIGIAVLYGNLHDAGMA